MSSGLFERYEDDYKSISNSINKKLNSSQLNSDSSTKRAIERELDEADEILQTMEMELSSFPPSTRTRLEPKLRQYRTDYEKLRMDLKKVSAASGSATTDRQELFSGLKSNQEDSVTSDQRTRLLLGTGKLNDASRRLDESHRIALETEEMGTSTLETLRNQRQQILRANDNLDDANGYIDRNIRILRDMARRATANKFLSVIIIIFLLFIIGLIIYFKFG